MNNMKFFRVFLALLGGTHVLCAQPSASPTVKSTGGSSLASVVAGSKPLNKPDFDDIAPRNVTAIVGQTAELNCFVKHPGDRVVSWIRKRDLHILTSSIYAYTGDERFSVKHPEASDEWTLKIDYVQQRDAGVYECQVNTEPKLNLAFVLRVEESAPVPATTTPNAIHRTFNSAAQAKILGPEEVYVKKGSTISLTCTVNVQSTPPSSVSWHHGGAVVDFDSPRGGVSLETEKTESGTTSRLLVTQARLTDSGNYTCIPSNANPASVMVHVLNGSPAPIGKQLYTRVHNRKHKLAINFISLKYAMEPSNYSSDTLRIMERGHACPPTGGLDVEDVSPSLYAAIVRQIRRQWLSSSIVRCNLNGSRQEESSWKR